MDLKNKRILGISQIIICLSLLLLYTHIGGMGMVYVAITMEIISFFLTLCFGDFTHTKHSLYCVLATIFTELMLFLINYFLIEPSEILYVGTLLKFSMLIIPIYVFLQWLKGVMQELFQPYVSIFAGLIFWVASGLFSFLSFLVLGNYGKRAADFMQSVKLEHFYVILSLVPGFLFGCLAAILFLLIIAIRSKDGLAAVFLTNETKGNVLLQCIKTFTTQVRHNLISLLQKLPVWVLLILSLKEIEADNYLFGHLYGAVLPILVLVWNIFDLSLASYKKRLYASFKKRMFEEYYHEFKSILIHVLIHSVFLFVCVFALHKPYLAIWSMQTSSDFMMLMKASSVIALLGFPYMVLTDILHAKNNTWECTVSVFFGTVMSLIVAAICNKFLGTGNALYILSLALGMVVTIGIILWFISNEVGMNYLSVLLKSYKLLVVNVFIGVILVIVQNLIFTAFGGLGTLLICIAFAYLVFWISIRISRVLKQNE